MKERPILFSGEMVRAILDGTKTQTRRVVKCPVWTGGVDAIERPRHTHVYGSLATARECAYGKLGDRLWVRETWAPNSVGCVMAQMLRAPDQPVIYYAATHPSRAAWRWRPSIHMPRWASRITLAVTAVRVERLQDISEADALAEGCPEWAVDAQQKDRYPARAPGLPRHWYAQLWDRINGAGAWDANPWVWVVEFRKVEGGAA